MCVITRDKALEDLNVSLERFGEPNPTSKNRGAELVMASLRTLRGRLGSPKKLRQIYLGRAIHHDLVPKSVYNIIERRVNGDLDRMGAEEEVDYAIEQYGYVIEELDVMGRI
jgi:hypothetical protein